MRITDDFSFEMDVAKGRFRYLYLCCCLLVLTLLFCLGGRGDVELSHRECNGEVVKKTTFEYSTETFKESVIVDIKGDDGARCRISVLRRRGEQLYDEAKVGLAGIGKGDRVQASCIRSNYMGGCEVVYFKKEEIVVFGREESEAIDVVKKFSAKNKRLKDFLIPLFLVLTSLEIWMLSRRSRRNAGRWRDG